MVRRHGTETFVGLGQFVEAPLPLQLPLLQQVDPVTLTHGTEPVGDHDDGLAVTEVVHRVHHCLLGQVVQGVASSRINTCGL